jgi:crotonobetainyl-CoA:carnitine CoA-transferase CaiB-like acyl-CoA transferase
LLLIRFSIVSVRAVVSVCLLAHLLSKQQPLLSDLFIEAPLIEVERAFGSVQTTDHWLAVFARLDVPAMACHTLHTLADDPHLRAVALVEHIQHPREGEVRAIRPTVILDNERPRSGAPAREIGADTHQVLARAGFAETEIADLLDAGTARAPQTGAR